MIVQGALDFQVYAEKDYLLWQDLFEGQEQVQFKLFTGLNHFFMPSSGKRDITDYDPANHMAPEVTETLAAWMKNLVDCK